MKRLDDGHVKAARPIVNMDDGCDREQNAPVDNRSPVHRARHVQVLVLIAQQGLLAAVVDEREYPYTVSWTVDARGI